MKDLIRIERLVTELAAQQLVHDDWWHAELASIKERLADVCFERGDMEAAIAALPAAMRYRVDDTRADRERRRILNEQRQEPSSR